MKDSSLHLTMLTALSCRRCFRGLSNKIEEYEDTLNLKMYAHVGELSERPRFELEPTEHQLSQEFYRGITAVRVKEIMTKRLREIG